MTFLCQHDYPNWLLFLLLLIDYAYFRFAMNKVDDCLKHYIDPDQENYP